MIPINRTPLSRDRILQAALKILDERGLTGLSMRKLAASLNVEAMSLYNHIKDKRDLMDGLANLVITQMELPDPEQPWGKRLERIALDLYGVLIQHPGIIMVLASEQGKPGDYKVIQGIDAIIAALAESGLSPTQQVNAYRGLLAMCFGFVFMHTQGLSKTRDQAQKEWDQWDSDQWDSNKLPNMSRLAPVFKQTHADDDFHFVLQAYLNQLRHISA